MMGSFVQIFFPYIAHKMICVKHKVPVPYLPYLLKYGRDAAGGTMAMTRATLVQMGGLAAFKDYVAEDVAMGRKAHDLGLRVGLGLIVDSPVGA
jgi:hypothetical protein